MRIEHFRSEVAGDRARVAASVCWEDCGRPTMELFYETSEEFADNLSCNPHAFLIACIMAAMRYREERVFVDASICPELKEGLLTAMSWMRHWYSWYGPDHKLPRIEAGVMSGPLRQKPPGRAGVFLSGGIDSLATLRANRLAYPMEHPGSFKDAILAFGLEVHKPESFEHAMRSMSALAERAGLSLIPVYTNVGRLGPQDYDDWFMFWNREFIGAVLASIAHVFSGRLSEATINACLDIPGMVPYGSHPLINPNYSSSDLLIRLVGITMSRYEKTRLISEWDLALRHLRVCNRTEEYTSEQLNCGRCEKCVRTMLGLLATEALGKATAFPFNDVTTEMVEGINIRKGLVPFYLELVSPLDAIGRHDLVRAIKRTILRSRINHWKKTWRKGAIEPIKDFDRRYVNGSLLRLKRSVFNRVSG